MIDLEELKCVMRDCDIYNIENMKENEKIFEELGVSSLEIMKIICCFEEKYCIRFTDKDLDFDESLTVSELLKLLNSI